MKKEDFILNYGIKKYEEHLDAVKELYYKKKILLQNDKSILEIKKGNFCLKFD